jgi:predicted nuclease of predicted toxin-antitoxin system
MLKLLANENFPLKSISYLIEKGFDVKGIGIHSPSILDSEVMKIAIEEERIILTFDRDYGELIFKHNYKPEHGVIYLRLTEYTPTEPGEIIESILMDKDIDVKRALTVVDSTHVLRQRKY